MKHLDLCGFPQLFWALLATGGLVLAGWVPAPVGAAVYKCVGKDGKAAFSDRPCPAGPTTTAVREPAGAPAQRAAIEAENKRNEDAANQRILADAACSEKRRVLNDRRAKLSTMSDSDKRVFAVVETGAARDCR